jgi:hypothetical protein
MVSINARNTVLKASNQHGQFNLELLEQGGGTPAIGSPANPPAFQADHPRATHLNR